MTLRVVPEFQRMYRSNTGRVSVNIGKVPRGLEIVSRGFGMVPEENGKFRSSSEWFRRSREIIGMVPGMMEWFRGFIM